MKSNLGAIQPQRQASKADLQEMAKLAWLERGVLTVQISSVDNEFDRLLLTQIAERLYGKRK